MGLLFLQLSCFEKSIAAKRVSCSEIQVTASDSARSVIILFPVQSARIEPGYLKNAEAMIELDLFLSYAAQSNSVKLIVVTGSASPEGIAAVNEGLALNRAKATKEYLLQTYPFLKSEQILVNSIGEDWDGLLKMVKDDPKTPDYRKVMELLGSDANSYAKEQRLKRIGNGDAYRYIQRNIFPYLRVGSTLTLQYNTHDIPTGKVITGRDTVYIYESRPAGTSWERPVNSHPVALKTNLLYDIALLPNLALEIAIPGRWSVEIEGAWSWWNSRKDNTYYHRIQAAGIEGRKWFGKKHTNPLTGHYLGLYAMGGTYDVKFSNTGYLSDWSYSAGISYGYSFPIGQKFNLEMGLAAGYLGGKYKDYIYDALYDDFPWLRTRERNYFGPTKAKVSLVWLLGKGNSNGQSKKTIK